MRSKHIVVLGSLRGVAALVVLIGHCILAYPMADSLRLPLDLVFNQRAAVLLFFVLSGYVLTLSWLRSSRDVQALWQYYLRRLFRILPALWLATALAWLLLDVLPPPPADAVRAHWSAWIASDYVPLTLRAKLLGFAAVNNDLIPPNWTITIELVGSFLLPLIVFGLARSRLWAAGIVAALFVISFVTMGIGSRLQIAAFMAMFALGACLALYPAPLDRRKAVAACTAGLVLIFGGRQLVWLLTTGIVHNIEYEINAPLPAMLEAAGAALLIAGLASGEVKARFLLWTPVRLVGDWSYSIYLLHFVFLRVAVWLLPPLPPVTDLLVLTAAVLAMTIPASALVYRFVELPGMALGRRLSHVGRAVGGTTAHA